MVIFGSFLLFRRQSSKVCMVVLIIYSKSLQAHNSSEPFPKTCEHLLFLAVGVPGFNDDSEHISRFLTENQINESIFIDM
jgi:hypothetical protein